MICAKAALLAERYMESGNVAVSAEELGVFAYGGIVEQGQYPVRAVAAAQAPYAVYILIGKGIVYVLGAHFVGTGKVAVAPCTRLLTLIIAWSGSVPTLKETVSFISPLEEEVEFIYSISSTPFTCCSSGAATVLAITSGLAPG